VHPDVIASYLDGTLATSLKRRVDSQMTPRRLGALRPEEAAVLALLQRRLAEEKRGDRLETQLRRSLRRAGPRRATGRASGQRRHRWRSTG
jgi:DNA topoisomerase I